MGAVSIDIHKNEREYSNASLSERDMVKYLILARGKIDIGYGANTNFDINQAGDIFDMNQEIISLYASLDKLVQNINLTNKQKIILKMFYDGHSVNDIAELTKGNRVSTYRVLDRIVDKIVEENNENWYYVMGMSGKIITP